MLPDPDHPTATTLVRTTPILAPPAAVWRALTDPAQGHRWLGDFRFETDWQVGAPFAIAGRLNGHDYWERGTLRALEPARLLEFDHFSPLWRLADRPEHYATLSLHLHPSAQGTALTYRHALPAVPALAQHADFFWRGAIYALQQLLLEA